MNIQKAVSHIINGEHGWAVADQFDKTFEGNQFNKCNYNALLYIRNTLDDIINDEIFNYDLIEELQEYRDNLEDYIVGGDDDEEAK